MIETSPTIAKLFEAFHHAQGEMDGVGKDAKNPHFRSKYATLENVMNTARPVLNAQGLSWTQAPGPIVDGRLTITTRVMHVSGEWMQSTFHMPVAKLDPQGVGSATTYACRYALMAILGLPPVEDDDGEQAMGRSTITLPAAAPAAGKKTSAQARKDGDWSRLVDEIEQCGTPEMLKQWGTSHRMEIAALPESWREHLQDAYQARMDFLRSELAGVP